MRDPNTSFDAALRRGVALFNRREFFAAHEAWEDAWRTNPGEPAYFLHGLIQIAAGFVKLQRGEPRGAFLNLDKGRRKLERFAPSRHGLDVAALLASVTGWIATARAMDASGRADYDAGSLPLLTLRQAEPDEPRGAGAPSVD